MKATTRNLARNVGLVLATTFSLAFATGASVAADSPSPPVVAALDAAQKPVEQIEELDEIWVRGKLLSQVIEDAEDDFFRLYNKLNTDSDYDVFCGVMALAPGSMIMTRKCSPGFIVYNFYDPRTGSVSYSVGSGSGSYSIADTGFGGCSVMNSYSNGGSMSLSTCGNGFGGFSEPSFPSIDVSARGAGIAELMLMEKRPAYAANVLKVLRSDSRLVEKVKGLDSLYKEMDLVQGRYLKVKGDKYARKARRGSKPVTGPRVL